MPYEVVSSEDMLARVHECNEKLAKEIEGQKVKNVKNENDKSDGQKHKEDKNYKNDRQK